MPPLTHLDRIEVGNEPELFIGELQIGQQLSAMHGQDSLDNFEFQDDLFLDQRIQSQYALQPATFVVDGYRHLRLNLKTAQPHLLHAALFINRLQ